MYVRLIGHGILQMIFLCVYVDENLCMLIKKSIVTLSYAYKWKYVSVD